MSRIFLSDTVSSPGPITVSGEKARYLVSVLRCRPGDNLIITDAAGNSYSARIVRASGKEVIAEITGGYHLDTESPLHITLIQGLLKGEKMDLVVQKASELGVKEIVPVITERSQLRATNKLPRWRKIAEEACRQSGRHIKTMIHEVMEFHDACSHRDLLSGGGILFWEEGGQRLSRIVPQLDRSRKIALFTGPEGGFSEKEVAAAAESGFSVASLGRRILRAETASIAVVAIIQYALGDLDREAE